MLRSKKFRPSEVKLLWGIALFLVVAAIAGALLGARHGAAAVPTAWRAAVHGWPGLTADDLVELAVRATGSA